MQSLLQRARFFLSFEARKSARSLQNFLHRNSFATEQSPVLLPYLIKEHSLPIRRNLSGVDPILFENKRINLELATKPIQGLLIPPKKIFSVWTPVGPPTAKRGFLKGLAIMRGKASESVGGGLCQLSNALFWLALHSDLQVIERHHHSLDLFPDDARKIPFGTGATLVYNFKDLRFYNPTSVTYQLAFEIRDDLFISKLYASALPSCSYKIVEEDHAFVEEKDGLYRKNTIVREKYDESGALVGSEVLFKNHSKCQYSL